MRIWLDTEFIEDGNTIELLSIGMVREDGATYYAEPAEPAETDRSRADEWVTAKVLPHLHGPVRPRAEIADELIQFAGAAPEFWAYYAAYDWVALCQLYGRMIDIPAGWPMFCRDVQQLRAELGVEVLPPQESTEHNALADALWTKAAHEFLHTVSRAAYAPAGVSRLTR
ncbi:3'-5' exoribonuclease domain-containing protein [Thioclava nitratireducens]|uniref:3'-5' exoribonuclease domain-containing protein n=1 Tax=Thioclava nitratireducens TaxID=1915078 RepID=UPI0024803518|nr:3'-5' exoribonuclease [Thioclava nitratireducens]WGT48910.1 3'-5' exoribonuclease [Thioclava nitratireducens]